MRLSRFSVSLTVALLVSVVVSLGLPPLPTDASQVKAIADVIKEAPSGILPPAKVAERFAIFAHLEGDPRRPYAIHHQLQSQAFYRTMIEQYFHEKMREMYHNAQSFGSSSKAISINVPANTIKMVKTADGGTGIYLNYPEKGHKAYDQLIDEFWRNNADIFVKNYLARINDGRELTYDGHLFASLYYELPSDKKESFASLKPDDAAQKYHKHLLKIYEMGVDKHIMPALTRNGPDDLRRMSSGESSSSGRGKWFERR